MRLSQEQETGISLVGDRDERIVSITGSAGTGKTTILKYAAEKLNAQKISTVLCAPTGKAARRISEATGLPALTIHKLLEFPQPADHGDTKYLDEEGKEIKNVKPHLPRRNKDRPFDYDCILVDEASMIGIELYDFLMAAIRRNGIIRFFGDINQLPPVEEVYGNLSPFANLLVRYPNVRLTKNYRSDDNLISNALRILASKMPIRNEGFEIIYTDEPFEDTIEYVGTNPTFFLGKDNQIITPQRRRGVLTTSRLNVALQVMFNKSNPESLTLERLDSKDIPILIRRNDKMIWCKNDYQFNILNGEIGSILDIDEESGEIALDIEDHPSPLIIPPRAEGRGSYGKYFYDPRKQIDLAYAVTTHKAQGAEFEEIIFAMSGKLPFLLNRNNLYTAITRAKKRVTIITDRRGIGTCLRKSV